MVSGCATHSPQKTIEWLDGTSLEIGAYLVPLNIIGHFMGGDPEGVISVINKTRKVVIAKKVLAAGRITPQEAFAYIKSIPSISGIAVGVASSRELYETLGEAKRYWKKERR
jgi:hypothetical protein